MKQNNDIQKYIPQRPPFVMVSELFEYNDRSVTSGFEIGSDNVLVQNGFFQEGGLVENMAQTAALFAGIHAHSANKEVPLGYIASIKNLKIERLPVVGERIKTTIEIVNEVMNMQIAMAQICDGEGNAVANCEMRIFIKPEEN